MRCLCSVLWLLLVLGEGRELPGRVLPRTHDSSPPYKQTGADALHEDLVIVERHYSSYVDTVSSAFANLLIGIVLVLLGFPVNYYNEKRQVHMEKIFDYAEKIVKPNVSTDRVDFSYEANLVHMIGETSTTAQLKDGLFNVTVQNCSKLRREVEMYQWVEKSSTETRDTAGGGKEEITTYTYKTEWSSVFNDSSSFKEIGHDNPPMPFESADQQVQNVSLGAFSLPESLIRQMIKFQDLKEEELPQKVTAGGKHFHLGGKQYQTYQGSPCVGDMRVKFEKVECGVATVLSVQHDDSFVPLSYDMVPQRGCFDFHKAVPQTVPLSRPGQPLLGKSSDLEMGGPCSCIGSIIELRECLDELREDSLPAGQMIQLARGDQKLCHIMGRLCGFLFFFIGFLLQFQFVPTLFRVIPWIGVWIQSFGNAFALLGALLMGLVFQCATLAYSWVMLKPLRAASLLCMAAALIIVPTLLANRF